MKLALRRRHRAPAALRAVLGQAVVAHGLNASVAAYENPKQPREALRLKAQREYWKLGEDYLLRGIANNPDEPALYDGSACSIAKSSRTTARPPRLTPVRAAPDAPAVRRSALPPTSWPNAPGTSARHTSCY